MSLWLTGLKALLPHVGTIIDAAKPVFTRKQATTAENPDAVLQQQVAELQAAVSQSASNIRELAAQLQSTVNALEQAGAAAEANLRRAHIFSLGAIVIATLSLCATVVVVLVLLSGTARAQEASRPEVKVGDRWTFAVWYTMPSIVQNRDWRVTAVGPVIEVLEDGQPVRLTPELGLLDSPLQSESNPRRLDFPLSVGKKWRYESQWLLKPKNSAGTSSTEVAVVAWEKVSVPAGTFDAFKLVARSTVGGKSPVGSVFDADIMITYWYAPEVRTIVRYQQHNPYTGPFNRDLVAFELK